MSYANTTIGWSGTIGWARAHQILRTSERRSPEHAHSLALAGTVKKFLLENGISNAITAKGLGESNPKYDNTNASLKQKNRRVEIYFITYN